jgi:esterase
MDLYFKQYGQGHPFIILHGLFGMGDNWAGIARKLGESFMCYTPDLRNHGKSPHEDIVNYQVMSEDVRAFMEVQWVFHSFLMGHSMGGKVAMRLALDNPAMVDKLIVVDMAPRRYEQGHDQIFKALLSVDLSAVSGRQDADDQLSIHIKDEGVRQFLLKNLHFNTTERRYEWKMNLSGIYGGYDNILEPVDCDQSFEKPALFIRGERSDYILQEDEKEIKRLFPEAKIITIPQAGHWVHADQPAKIIEVISDFLNDI